MSDRVSLLDRPTVPEISPEARVPAGPRSIAVVDLLAGTPLLVSLGAAAAGRGLRLARARLTLRTRPGHEVAWSGDAVDAAAHPDALLDAARELLATAPAHELLVLEGAALLAATVPALALLGATSPSLALMPVDVRVVRDRFDVVLYGDRPGAVRRLVELVVPPA